MHFEICDNLRDLRETIAGCVQLFNCSGIIYCNSFAIAVYIYKT